MPADAIYVGRPTQWGNPFEGGANSLDNYRAYAIECGHLWLSALRGHDLACWCPLCKLHKAGRPFDVACPDCPPCHADVLLELANG